MLARLTRFVRKHPDLDTWFNDHPKLVRIVQARFNSKTFFGLPLSVLVVSSLACLVILVGIIQDYLARDPFLAADVRIANLLFSWRSVPGVHFFYALTLLASPLAGLAVIGLLVAVLLHRKQWLSGIICLAGLMGAEGATAVLKVLIHRPRPDLLLRAIAEDSYSLPSGHATTAAFVFGYLGYLAFLRFRSKKTRALTFFAVAAAVFLIDMSRLYLGVHYVSDVIAGNMIGFLALIAAIATEQWLQAKKRLSVPVLSSKVIAGAIAISVLAAAATYASDRSPWETPTVPEVQSMSTSDVLNLFASDKLPTHTENLIGERQEPISLILIVPEVCLAPDLNKAGWTLASPLEPSSIFAVIKAAIVNDEYLSAPMTPSFYRERPHDFGFEKPTAAATVRQRHHARFWDTFYETPEGRVIVATASLDTGIKWGVTHSIAPDIDTERDTLVADLVNAGVVASREEIKHFVDPVLGQNFTTDYFFTNGDAVLLTLVACR